MTKRYSLKFWLLFWGIAVALLSLWFVFLESRRNPLAMLDKTAQLVPLTGGLGVATDLAHYMLQEDGKERTVLFLLQNNLELRPGGGYLGTFGIVKVKDGHVTSQQVHNTNVFDGRVPHLYDPPYPMKETLGIPSWQMRDSNYAPDFPTNALKAEEFYKLGGGSENFDAIIAVNANVLSTILDITGPITLPGILGTYSSENVLLQLEHQVEKAYYKQGINEGDRKVVVNDLAKIIVERISKLSLQEKIALPNRVAKHLSNKDIQILFKDKELQQRVIEKGWDGAVDTAWQKDYLMIVDANLSSLKSDYHVKRAIDYYVDFSKGIPEATLRITYTHTAKQKDWMTRDYQTFLRVYVPEKAWFVETTGNISKPVYGESFGKKYTGFLVHVPLGETRMVELRYNLPLNFKGVSAYDLMIQKQSGVYDVPVVVTVVEAQGTKRKDSFVLNEDTIVSEIR